MNQSDRKAFGNEIAALCEPHGKKATAPLVELYWRVLQHYTLEQVRHGIRGHMSDPDTGQFFAKPADIIRHIDGGTETQAMNAWSKLIGAIRRLGHNKTVVFDDWKIHAVVHDMGGWQEVCSWPHDKLPFIQKDFEKLYRSMKPGRQYPPKLVGYVEHINEQNGHGAFIPDPVLIGDTDRAQQVLAAPEATNASIGGFAATALSHINSEAAKRLTQGNDHE